MRVDREASEIALELLRAQDPEACRALILRHHAPLYRFLAHLTHDARVAEELTAEVFAAAWKALPAFDGRSSLATWLHRIAYTKFIDSRRRESRHASRANGLAASGVQLVPARDPFAGLLLDESARGLREALAELPDSDRALVLMHYTQRLSYSDIAEVAGEPEGTIKWRMSRLLKTLREKLLETTDGDVQDIRPAGAKARA